MILLHLLAPFTVQNQKKNPKSGSRVKMVHNFWAQNGTFASKKTFLEKRYNNFHVSFSAFY